VPGEAEDEGFGYSKARTTTKNGAIFTATQGLGPISPISASVVARRHPTPGIPPHGPETVRGDPGIRRSALLELGKIGSQRCPRESDSQAQATWRARLESLDHNG
jgi:hypothetical protein